MDKVHLTDCVFDEDDLSPLIGGKLFPRTRSPTACDDEPPPLTKKTTKNSAMSKIHARPVSSHPNRGRGHRRPPRGRGRGSSGQKATQTFDCGNGKSVGVENDDIVLDVKPKPEERNNSVPKHKSAKIAMQKLTLTPENEAMVVNTLLHLSENPDLAKGEGQPQACSIDDLQPLPNSHNFKLDNRLVIEDIVNNNNGRTDSDPKVLYQFQVKKLQKYGFDRTRSLDALVSREGDIGDAVELLLAQCLPEFHTDFQTTMEEAKEQRQDEAVALSSIYGDKFTEKIRNRIWLLDLDLPLLTKLNMRKKDCVSRDERKVCDYYLKGSCKFGNKCRLRHVSRAELDTEHERASQSLYHVEIRFPPESLYPFQPPLVAFLSKSYFVKPDLCLKITARLMQAAAELAGSSAVFSILALLDDENEVKKLIDAPAHPLSLPPTMPPVPNPEIIEKESSAEFSDVSYSDSETESLPDITNCLTPESCPGEEKPEENAVTLALKRRQREDKLYGRTLERMQQDNKTIRRKFKMLQSNTAYQKMVNHRKELPAWSKKNHIVDTIKNNQCTVISGTTGCGKTTQVPQFILDACIEDGSSDLGQIICTQPRRISALAVAERVAQERTERLGDVVGYQIRLESCVSSYTRLMYCTTGILLRRLETDTFLVGVSHVVIDEVHERSEDSDFLMMILRDLCRRRLDLKLILMSATLNADLFSQYFDVCPVVNIPGKMFPVARRYLEDVIEVTGYTIDSHSPYIRHDRAAPKERDRRLIREHDIEDEANGKGPTAIKGKIADKYLSQKQLAVRYAGYKSTTIQTMFNMDMEKINYDLIEELLKYRIETNLASSFHGTILIFLPGFLEINTLYDQLLSNKLFCDKSRFTFIPLHSTLSSEEQQAVFKKSHPGMIKVVIATNIAETSITIDDVICVIDAGRMKERRYDVNCNMESLDLCWISRANAIQREGRAGRVATGTCYHLFTNNQFHHQLRDQPIPEIQRVPLERMVLKILDIFRDRNVEDVMNQLLEPPLEEAITSAIERLQDLGALDRGQHLTPLGYHLAFLPVDVRIGKLMLYGVVMRCLDSALTIAASLSYKSPFLSPFSRRDEANKCKRDYNLLNSDHLTVLQAYNAWLEADKAGTGYSFCEQNFLSMKTLKMLASLKRQYVELLSDIGFVAGDISMKRMERAACRGSDGVKENTPSELNKNALNMKIVSSVLGAALYPQVVQIISPERRYYESSVGAMVREPSADQLKFRTKNHGYVSIHPSSVNFDTRTYDSPFLVYHEKIRTSKVYLRDCSMIYPYSLIMFAGGKVHIAIDQERFVLFIDDGWIRCTAENFQVASMIKKLREQFDRLLQEKIENPDVNLATCPRGNVIIETIVRILLQ